MNIDQAVDRACQEPTLEAALSWICVWESERAIEQALRNVPAGIRDADGKSWDTCFGHCIRLVMIEYGRSKNQQHTPILDDRGYLIRHEPFHPAFDTPRTAEEALQVIEAWGNPSCATFNAARSKRCAELLKPVVDRDHFVDCNDEIVQRAVITHNYKWPAELTSGVMFYAGQRVTIEQFNRCVKWLAG